MMKTYFTFILVLMFGFISTAQHSSFKNIETSIAIKPSLTLVDFSDTSFYITPKKRKFSTFKYAQNLNNQSEAFKMEISNTQIIRADFMVFNPKLLKRSFFRDFNGTYKRSELQRLLPKLPDVSDFISCF